MPRTAPKRPWPWGALAASATAAALVLDAPWGDVDAAIALRARARLSAPTSPGVAVLVDPADGGAVARLAAAAREAGAASVELPDRARVAGSVAAPVRVLDGAALLEGRAPVDLLRGQAVVIDAPGRAQARVLADSLGSPLAADRRTGAAAAALAALVLACLAGRARPAVVVAGLAVALAAAAGLALGAARAGVAEPVLELAAAALLTGALGAVDRARILAATLRQLAGPVLRAAATTAGATRGEAAAAGALGPGLAELLDARALLLLAAPPGAPRLRVEGGFRLRASSLKERAPLDPRGAPYRDASGLAVVAPAVDLVEDEGAELLPLAADGLLEGVLVVVPDGGPRTGRRLGLAERPATVAAVGEALARVLTAARRAGGPRAPLADRGARLGRLLAEAAHDVEREASALAAAAARAHAGWLLCTPAGGTRWKNPRFDALTAHAAPQATGDLARVLALVRAPAETAGEALERLLGGAARARVAAPAHRLVVTVTPIRAQPAGAPTALLVELEPLDAIVAAAVDPRLVAGASAAVTLPATAERANLLPVAQAATSASAAP